MSVRIDHNTASPAGMKALGAVYGHVLQSGLPSRLVELVFLRVSQINGCAFCIDMHTTDLVKKGVPTSTLLLTQVWREAESLFDDRERAALAWAESVTLLADTGVPDADYAAASAHFTEKELVDLTIAIGLINAYNRLAVSFRAAPASVKR